jgi:hypothetical protein
MDLDNQTGSKSQIVIASLSQASLSKGVMQFGMLR